jgi:hypothetical protein
MKKALVMIAALAFALPGCSRQGGSGSVGALTAPSAVVRTDVPPDPCAGSVTATTTGEDPVCGTGRFTGGGFQIADDVKVTRGFTIHCDLLLSNNLEINWGRGNNFHMLEHVTTVSCTDSPEIEQQPPDSPVDTIVGIGTGRYNGVDGYTIDFRLEDHGEPGKYDRASFVITGPAGVVLNVPIQRLGGGNIQTHFDQPHK